MNKKLIAITIASVMATPVMAEITMNGKISGELTIQPKEITAANTGFNSTTGKFDTKGTAEDAAKAVRFFGDTGTSQLNFMMKQGKAYGKIGLATNVVMNGSSPGARDGYLGYNLSDSSSIQMGRMSGAAKNLEKDAYIATFLQSRGTAAEAVTGAASGTSPYGSSSFIGNIIQYKTKLAGGSFTVQYDPTDNDVFSGNDGHMGFAFVTKVSGIDVYASYNTGQANNGGTSTKHVNAKVGGTMKMGNIKLNLNVSNADNNKTGVGASTSTAISATFGLGKGLSANVAYAANGDLGTWVRGAVTKKLSGASVFAGVTSATAAASGSKAVNVMGVGMSASF